MPMDEAMFASVREANGPTSPATSAAWRRRSSAPCCPRRPRRRAGAAGRRRHYEPDPETAGTAAERAAELRRRVGRASAGRWLGLLERRPRRPGEGAGRLSGPPRARQAAHRQPFACRAAQGGGKPGYRRDERLYTSHVGSITTNLPGRLGRTRRLGPAVDSAWGARYGVKQGNAAAPEQMEQRTGLAEAISTPSRSVAFAAGRANGYFEFPIVAIVGENGAGKSTVLQAAASIYRGPLRRMKFASAFFPDTPWEKTQKAHIRWWVREGQSSREGSIRKETKSSARQPRAARAQCREHRLSRIQPVSARGGYFRLAKPQHKEVSATVFDADKLARLSGIMGRRYEIASMSLTDFDKTRSVPVIAHHGSRYSGFHGRRRENDGRTTAWRYSPIFAGAD